MLKGRKEVLQGYSWTNTEFVSGVFNSGESYPHAFPKSIRGKRVVYLGLCRWRKDNCLTLSQDIYIYSQSVHTSGMWHKVNF